MPMRRRRRRINDPATKKAATKKAKETKSEAKKGILDILKKDEKSEATEEKE